MQTAQALTSVSLIAIYIQLISGGRCPDSFIVLNGIYPHCPARSWLWFRPASIGCKDFAESDDPWRELDIDKGDVWAEEEWTRGVCSLDNLLDLRFQFAGVLDLLSSVLRLEQTVEMG